MGGDSLACGSIISPNDSRGAAKLGPDSQDRYYSLFYTRTKRAVSVGINVSNHPGKPQILDSQHVNMLFAKN